MRNNSLSVMHIKKGGLFILIALLIPACLKVPPVPAPPTERIPTGPGPEDMVLDTLNGDPRLIISSQSRRDNRNQSGMIVSLDLYSGDQKELVRYNEPAEMLFRPHGIYLEKDLLYVISHEREPDLHPILIYRVNGDSLEFNEMIRTGLQHSPNALVTGPSGDIYFVNDSGKRGSTAEKAFRLKRASLVHLARDGHGGWTSEIVAGGLGYPAGINRMGDMLFVGDAVLHRIHLFTISGKEVTPAGSFRGFRGVDNIRIHRGQLLVPGHVKPLRFIRHTRDAGNLSPVHVFLVNPETGASNSVFITDGSLISGGSTAIIFRDQLYISQVFDPYLLKVDLRSVP